MDDFYREALINAMTDSLPLLREKLNLTQEQMGKVLGVSRITYLNLENKNRRMSWTGFLALFAIFAKNQETAACLEALGIRTPELEDWFKNFDK